MKKEKALSRKWKQKPGGCKTVAVAVGIFGKISKCACRVFGEAAKPVEAFNGQGRA